jgi:hypothetical protein
MHKVNKNLRVETGSPERKRSGRGIKEEDYHIDKMS